MPTDAQPQHQIPVPTLATSKATRLCWAGSDTGRDPAYEIAQQSQPLAAGSAPAVDEPGSAEAEGYAVVEEPTALAVDAPDPSAHVDNRLVLSLNPLTWLRLLGHTIFSSFLYVPFVFSVLVHSCLRRRAFETTQWRKYLTGTDWSIGSVYYAVLLAYPLVTLFTPTVYAATGPISEGFSLRELPFFCAVLCVHALTIQYVYLRPELSNFRIPTNTRFTVLQWHNALALLSVLIEFGQLCSICLQAPVWELVSTSSSGGGSGGDHEQQTIAMAADKPALIRFLLLSWANPYVDWLLAVGLVLVFGVTLGVFIALQIQPTATGATLLYSFIPGTLFLSIASRLLALMALPNDDGDGGIETLSRAYSVGVFYAYLFYASTAPFVAVYRTDELQRQNAVQYTPKFNIWERTLKSVICLWAESDLTNRITLTSATVAYTCVLIALLTMLLHARPCSYMPLAYGRCTLLGAALWLFWVTLLSVYMSWPRSVAIVVLVVGWAVLLSAILGLLVLGYCRRRRQQRVMTTATAITISSATTALTTAADSSDDHPPSRSTPQHGHDATDKDGSRHSIAMLVTTRADLR